MLAFVEKPDAGGAERYLVSGHYYWNSGMFLFAPAAISKNSSVINLRCWLAACSEAIAKAKKDFDFIRLDRDGYAASPENSIDYAVMEYTTLALMVAMTGGWSDVGSWASVWEGARKDGGNNATQSDIVLQDRRSMAPLV